MNPTNEQKNIGQLAKASKNVKVIAGAGTGKSSTLRYLAKQVPARNVLVLTFNKANAEDTLAHADRPENLFASTIHSLAYRAVIDPFYKKKLSNYLDYNDINLTDLTQAIYATGLPSVADEKKALVLYRRTILDCIKLFCQSGDLYLKNFAENYIKYVLVTAPSEDIKFKIPFEVALRLVSITEEYWTSLVEGAAKISHDIYLKLFHLWECSIKEVWSTEHKRYMTVQVLAIDEHQDSNEVTNAIFKNQRHLQRIVVGDPNQCIVKGTIVNGKPIEEIKVGDLIPTAINGFILHNRVTGVKETPIKDELITFTTAKGKTLTSTKRHTHFAHLPDTYKEYVVYLMYKKSHGFRIGLTKDIAMRCKGETADAIWILKTFGTDLLATRVYETTTSYNYKIPETIFKIAGKVGELPQETLDEIWSKIDSRTGALQLLNDLGLDVNLPHYQPVKYLKEQMNVTITLNGDTRNLKSPLHRYSVILPPYDAVRFKEVFPQYNVRSTGKSDNSMRVEGCSSDLGKGYELWKDIKQVFPEARLKELANIAEHKSLEFFPTLNLVVGMEVLVEVDGVLVLDNIVSIEKHYEETTVYDINVEKTHNFIANGVVTHNCIYSWRGAINAMGDFNDFELGYLSESFRFNTEIARMANIVLERNNSPLRLIGSGKHTEITTRAILCRTNATVLETFFDLVTSGNYTGKINVSTDVKTTFSKMYHLQAAYFNKEIKYPVSELSSITDQASMLEAVDYSEELVRLNNLCLKLCDVTGSLYMAQQLLVQYTAGKGEVAELTISTLHASKGLEFSHVTIADDFIALSPETDLEYAIDSMWDDVDLKCALYVGVTRAMVEVKLPWYLEDSFRR